MRKTRPLSARSVISALVEAGAICATPEGTVAPLAIAIVLADWIEPAMHVAPSPISLRAAFTADAAVDPSSAESILIVMSLTPSLASALFARSTASSALFWNAGPNTAPSPVSESVVPTVSVNPALALRRRRDARPALPPTVAARPPASARTPSQRE